MLVHLVSHGQRTRCFDHHLVQPEGSIPPEGHLRPTTCNVLLLSLGETSPAASDVNSISSRRIIGCIFRRRRFVDFVYVVVSCFLMVDREVISFEPNGPAMVGRREE